MIYGQSMVHFVNQIRFYPSDIHFADLADHPQDLGLGHRSLIPLGQDLYSSSEVVYVVDHATSVQ